MSATSQPRREAVSFVGGLRYPAPDVARGLMLLLIAVANIPFWLLLIPKAVPSVKVDQWWILIRGLFVDHRIYPLFALLFGFGLMTMIQRRQAVHIERRTAELDQRAPALTGEERRQWIDGFAAEAQVDSRRLIRRRGWWMLLFGAVHALFFSGDIIGAYALVAVFFAGVLAAKRWRAMTVWGVVFGLVSVLMSVGQAFAVKYQANGVGYENLDLSILWHWWYPIASLISWVFSTPMTVIGAIVVPCVFIGAWVATTDLLVRPDLHRRQLIALAVAGLLLGALLALPHSLLRAGFLEANGWAGIAYGPLHEFGGYFGGIGWLALLALLAGPARETLSGWQSVMSAVGRRSMTAYIGQTVLFGLIFVVIGNTDLPAPSQALAALVAVGVWLLTVAACWAMERAGYSRGPLEVLLRKAVAKSEKKRPLPEIPELP